MPVVLFSNINTKINWLVIIPKSDMFGHIGALLMSEFCGVKYCYIINIIGVYTIFTGIIFCTYSIMFNVYI